MKLATREEYEAAIHACDEAWDAVLGAFQSGFFALCVEEYGRFRTAYARKVWLHRMILTGGI